MEDISGSVSSMSYEFPSLGAASLLLQRVLKLVLVENTVVVRIGRLEHPYGARKQALAGAHLLSREGADGMHAMRGHLPQHQEHLQRPIII